jgi:glycosyltransferase involved in cell wall biosynthesis
MASELENIVDEAIATVTKHVADFEILVVDNASTDESWNVLERLTHSEPRLNLHAMSLANRVDSDTAAWAGIENSIGDAILVFDPSHEAIAGIDLLLAKARLSTVDVLMLRNVRKKSQTLAYRAAKSGLNLAYRAFNGFDLTDDAPQLRLLSKRVIAYIQGQANPQTAYRNIPLARGFTQTVEEYSALPATKPGEKQNLRTSYDRGNRLLFSSSNLPLRSVAILSLVGAVANVAYSIYVFIVALSAKNIAPGWVSTSLQLSGMFFLISLVLMVICEYLIHMIRSSNSSLGYFVAGDLTSKNLSKLNQLNVDEEL